MMEFTTDTIISTEAEGVNSILTNLKGRVFNVKRTAEVSPRLVESPSAEELSSGKKTGRRAPADGITNPNFKKRKERLHSLNILLRAEEQNMLIPDGQEFGFEEFFCMLPGFFPDCFRVSIAN
jgi:hypothetical protein